MYAGLLTPAATQTASLRVRRQHLRNLIDPASNPGWMSRQPAPFRSCWCQHHPERSAPHDVLAAGGRTVVMPRIGVVWPQWQREELRTNLWLVPTIVILGALGLFGLTLRLDRAAYQGRFRPPRG